MSTNLARTNTLTTQIIPRPYQPIILRPTARYSNAVSDPRANAEPWLIDRLSIVSDTQNDGFEFDQTEGSAANRTNCIWNTPIGKGTHTLAIGRIRKWPGPIQWS
ncbi:hypothetical protein IPJ72_00010 [Candidatus Peregrinibacteria bacterium]|nr:MAG: hypothetical protein IPJ72_00010 [Candidatus Peregrinibacteria bacterium]